MDGFLGYRGIRHDCITLYYPVIIIRIPINQPVYIMECQLRVLITAVAGFFSSNMYHLHIFNLICPAMTSIFEGKIPSQKQGHDFFESKQGSFGAIYVPPSNRWCLHPSCLVSPLERSRPRRMCVIFLLIDYTDTPEIKGISRCPQKWYPFPIRLP